MFVGRFCLHGPGLRIRIRIQGPIESGSIPDPQHCSFPPGHTPRWLRRWLIVGTSTIRRSTTIVQILVLAPVRTDVSEIDVVQALHAPNDHVQLIVVGPADMSQLQKYRRHKAF
jgi:hypothetical protein